MTTLTPAERILQELTIRVNLAVKRGSELDEDIRAWRTTQPMDCEVTVKPDHMGWVVEITKFDPAPPLDEWGIRFGEIAHHYRSILNTMLTRIAVEEGIDITPRLQFPITQEHQKWVGKGKNKGERDRLKGLPDRIVRAIYGTQPFILARQYKKHPMYDVLSVLAWTDNQDKHRVELRGNLTPLAFQHDFKPVFADPAAHANGAVRMRFTYDYSMEIGSYLVDADTSPYAVTELKDSDFDLTMDIGFLDEAGDVTPVQLVLEEFRGKVLNIIGLLLTVWEDPTFDTDVLAGSTDFQKGAAFGRAAVNSLAGGSTWEKDFTRSERGKAARLRDALGDAFGILNEGPTLSDK